MADLVRRTGHEIGGAALVTRVRASNNIEQYMLRHGCYLRPTEISKLVFKKMLYKARDRFSTPNRNGRFYSVRKVYEWFGIDYFEVHHNINMPAYLQRIKRCRPDVIISSNSLIFGEKLLNLPQYCINRHSALLPSYGGLWPVFQAVRSGESCVGVSVHTMEKKIDQGILLSQVKIPVEKGDSIDTLYQKCFNHSAQVVMDALRKIEDGDLSPVINDCPPSYYSFPVRDHWRQLRARNIKFV